MLMLDGKVEVKRSVFPRSFLALPKRGTYIKTLLFQAVMIPKTLKSPRCNCL